MSESIVKNELRVGRFTSSQIGKLMKSGRSKSDIFSVAAHTYIKHKAQERKRGRSMSMDASSPATAWGDLMEARVYDLVGLEYTIQSRQTTVHPKYSFWSGSRDLIVPNSKIAEIKGYYPEKFCSYADVLLSKDLMRMKKEFDEEYWQIVSNCILNNVPNGEAILYQPYESEAMDIAELADNHPDVENLWQFKSIHDKIMSGELHRLPFQPDLSQYPNLITFEFKVPEADMEALTQRVIMAEELLQIKYFSK
jgi:hypothetical protein